MSARSSIYTVNWVTSCVLRNLSCQCGNTHLVWVSTNSEISARYFCCYIKWPKSRLLRNFTCLTVTKKKIVRDSPAHCNTQQHPDTHCDTLQRTATFWYFYLPGRERNFCQSPAQCIILQHTATHCNTRQHTATQWNMYLSGRNRNFCHSPAQCNTLGHMATQGNTWQHKATHGNTRQHMATYGNTLKHAPARLQQKVPSLASAALGFLQTV